MHFDCDKIITNVVETHDFPYLQIAKLCLINSNKIQTLIITSASHLKAKLELHRSYENGLYPFCIPLVYYSVHYEFDKGTVMCEKGRCVTQNINLKKQIAKLCVHDSAFKCNKSF